MAPLFVVLAVIIVSGALGGLINSYLSEQDRDHYLSWRKHIVVGVGAALVIPLFLNSISANLITEILGSTQTPPDDSKLFVLAGFCILAAVVSRSFITSVSSKLFRELDETKKEVDEAKNEASQAKQTATRAENVVAPFVEDDRTDFPQAEELYAIEIPQLSSAEKTILQSMVTSRYAMRSLTGLAKDAKMDKQILNTKLTELIGKDLVRQGESSKGEPRWYVTETGRLALLEAK